MPSGAATIPDEEKEDLTPKEKMDKRMRDAKREANDAEQAVEHKDEQIGDICDKMTKLEKKLKAVKEALDADDPNVARNLLTLASTGGHLSAGKRLAGNMMRLPVAGNKLRLAATGWPHAPWPVLALALAPVKD